MKFKIGDKVSFLNEPGGGELIGFKGRSTAIVLMENGIEIPFPIDQLVEKSRQNEKQKEATPVKAVPTDFAEAVKKIQVIKVVKEKEKKPEKKISKARTILEDEVDLHIECLLDSHRGMSNAEIIQVQLSCFTRALDHAIRNNYYRIVFIHGVGKGRLKEEIYHLLRTYKGISFRAAPYEKYGFGATEVLIK